ncbi:uncharacterized protein LAESUDRAFT_687444 [Laetiporus sulphureus 93-53]|uniref:Protein-S-isoprenylcysteine O-methyltransferase n=1 Tax=Laetiporus sulphureus 93-53 TaxID=1314785 RepID=A0A165BEK3_9APHY|nr:uncharacterized protein LAESUDRAFT_687444 [Laetiporus sulphureus 93-53]KZT00886.1 hypothetical protein LAESUDRAFT_687444 [Laetiporus sulphureus 93-53]
MSLAKIPLLLIVAISNHITYTPPNPPPAKTEIMKDISLAERFFTSISRQITAMFKMAGWIVTICEIAVILAQAYPSSRLAGITEDHLVVASRHSTYTPQITPTFLLVCGLAAATAMLRLLSYRVMGRHFTYEMTLLENHKLCTSGPYSVVRHPSYTGLVMNGVMFLLWITGDGSWARESGLFNNPVGMVVTWWFVASQVYGCSSVLSRMPKEDEVLRREFGQQWVEWADRVPWRLVPGIH